MKPKRSDDVFLLTLVDFLLQILFFGLFMGVVWIVGPKNQPRKEQELLEVSEQRAVIEAKRLMGVSNFAQITDTLTRLAPISKLSRFDSYSKLVEDNGGIETIKARLDKLDRIERGFGKPPCLFTMQKGHKVSTPIAAVIANDNTIRFVRSSPEMEALLKTLGRTYPTVETLSLTQFRVTFGSLRNLGCFYTLQFIEHTRYVDARDAAESGFYLEKSRPTR